MSDSTHQPANVVHNGQNDVDNEPITSQSLNSMDFAGLFSEHRDREGWESCCSYAQLSDAYYYRVWRRPYTLDQHHANHSHNGVYEYKFQGALPYAAPHFFAIQTDLEYHRTWDEHCTKLQVMKDKSTQHCDLVYWVVKYPWPMSNRDYAYYRRTSVVNVPSSVSPSVLSSSPASSSIDSAPQTSAESDSKEEAPSPLYENDVSQSIAQLSIDNDAKTSTRYYVSIATATPESAAQVPLDKSNVRVDLYRSLVVVRQRGDNSNACEFALTAVDDPRAAIPKAIMNWVTSKGIPSFMDKLKAACANYPVYQSKLADHHKR